MENIQALLKKSGMFSSTSSDRPIDMEAYARQKVERANAEPGKLTGYDCPKCLNRGYTWKLGEGLEEIVQECSCMEIRRSIARLKNSGLSDMLERYTFQNWQTPELWQEKSKAIAQKYAAGRQGWFLAMGRPGSGKTHLCTAICGNLLKAGKSVRYMLWRDVAVQAKAAVNDEEEYYRIVNPLKTVDVLYIDDLFKTGGEERNGQKIKKAPSAADVNLAFELLNSRYNDRSKLTIISTERNMDELLDIDEAIGSRIYERSKGYRLDFSNKPNWRLKT